MYEYILGVVTSYSDGFPVQARDLIRYEQAVALLSCRLERGGGIPVPMALVPSVLGGMICSYSFTSVACGPNLHDAVRPACVVCDREEVVTGSANHCYNWVNSTKERYTQWFYGYLVLFRSMVCGKRGLSGRGSRNLPI